jgi:hypothetical protein
VNMKIDLVGRKRRGLGERHHSIPILQRNLESC